MPTYDAIDFVKAVTTTASAVGTQDCQAVSIQADPDNTVDVFLGTATSQSTQLSPGESFTIPISNLSKIFAKTGSGTANLNILAVI